LAANSWMQTPAGFEIVGGQFFPSDWFQVIFNPSFPYRLVHTVLAFFVTTGFVVLGVGAYDRLRRVDGRAHWPFAVERRPSRAIYRAVRLRPP